MSEINKSISHYGEEDNEVVDSVTINPDHL